MSRSVSIYSGAFIQQVYEQGKEMKIASAFLQEYSLFLQKTAHARPDQPA
jgi:hypothetical protein